MTETRTHKTVTVALQLRVPRKMRVQEVDDYVQVKLMDAGFLIRVYRGRVEFFGT